MERMTVGRIEFGPASGVSSPGPRTPAGARLDIAKLCRLYDARLAAAGAPEKVDPAGTGFGLVSRVKHLRWMLATMPGLSAEKANRWLGFVQGVLFALDYYTIDELRAHVTEALG